MVATTVFWVSAVAMAWVWLGYPMALAVWRCLAARPVCKGDHEPRVTVVVAAHNEAGHIEAKIHNCLHEQDYPPDRLRMVVSLDGPTDGTDRIVHGLADEPRLKVCHSERRRGKAAALNAAMERVEGEIVVFADARQRFEPDAVRNLVAPFGDASVGAVSGELVLHETDDQGGADRGRRMSGAGETEDGGKTDDGDAGADRPGGVGLYWRYEKLLRRMESDIHSTLGATGAIYAIRRDLLAPIPEETLVDDMMIPLRVVLQGRRIVFEPAARAHDRVCEPQREFRRKVRTLAGNYQLMTLMPELLDPRRNPVFLQLVSHKLGRLAVPWLLATLYVSSLVLHLDAGGLYSLAFYGQTAWYFLAVWGLLDARPWSWRRGSDAAADGSVPEGLPARNRTAAR